MKMAGVTGVDDAAEGAGACGQGEGPMSILGSIAEVPIRPNITRITINTTKEANLVAI